MGVHKEDWEALREYREMKQQLAEGAPAKEVHLLYGKEDAFGIYQLKDGAGMRDYHFEPYDRLQAAGLSVEATNYDLIYTAELTPGTSLEDIYTRFNIDHPKDFRGHSLSVSDIVVLHQNGENTAHYWSFCHIHSPYYILLFLFLFEYVYTVPVISQNRAYY